MDENEQTREVYAYFGLALYFAQVLEHQLVNTMVASRLAARSMASLAELDGFTDSRFRRTLGRLITEIQAQVSVPEGVAQLLEQALARRNWLAHRYFRERAREFMTASGRLAMLEELREAHELFQRADEPLTNLAREFRQRVGISDERVRAEYERALRETGNEG